MLRIKRLRTRLVLLLLGLLVLVLGAVFVAVYSATDSSANRQARQQLDVGSNVFARLLELRARELSSATQVLVADFGFRDAVASGDLPTIRSALINQSARIGADEALFFDLAGQVRESSRTEVGARIDISAVQPLTQDALLAVIDGRPYLLVEAVVMAPVMVGQVAMAFRLDEALALEMQKLTGLQVSFVTSLDSQVLYRISTLGDTYEPIPNESNNALTIEDESYLGLRNILLEQQGYQVSAELLSPRSEALAIFDLLKQELAIITLIALTLSSLVAMVIAGNLSRPVKQLADSARQIGLGDFSQPVSLPRDDELGLLASSIDTMRQGIAERERQIAHSAYHDPLTGLANVLKVAERLSEGVQAGRKGVLIRLFLDAEAEVLTSVGQTAHSRLMVAYAGRLNTVIPTGGLLAYQPGQGFLLVLDGLDVDQAVIASDLLLTALSERMQVDEVKLTLTWLAGIVVWPEQGSDAESLLRQVGIAAADAQPGPARIAVYQAKRDEAYMRRMRLIRDIHFAPQLKELTVVYQPKLDIRTGEVRQLEALMRWTHSELGAIRPDEFIILAEQTGSIHRLTQWMLAAVVSQLGYWIEQGLEMQVAMNLSALDLDNPDFPEQVARILRAQEIPARYIAFEVTESALMNNPAASLQSLQRLRELDIELAIDDYGTGYSSLATIKSLPVQQLKIDKSFVLNLATSSDDLVIVKSTIELAHNMGLKVVAEGVEDADSLSRLQQLGCNVAQGYFISRPLAARDLEQWLQANRDTYRQRELS